MSVEEKVEFLIGNMIEELRTLRDLIATFNRQQEVVELKKKGE